MSINFFNTIKDAIANLDPNQIRAEVERPIRVGLFASTEHEYEQMEAYFRPAGVTARRLQELGAVVQRGVTASPNATDVVDPKALPSVIEIHHASLGIPRDGFSFDVNYPERTVSEILRKYPDLGIPLARHILPFRDPVVDQIIKKISKENALFSLATALPDIVPFISLPWAIGEFASDTAVLTANQIRMAFLLAAASDYPVGYREQKAEMVSILLSAFGWRAVARELVGKIPFGGGLIPKAAVAYAGTRVAGMSLERYYRIGYGYSQQERDIAYQQALDRGKTIAGRLLHGMKQGEPAN